MAFRITDPNKAYLEDIMATATKKKAKKAKKAETAQQRITRLVNSAITRTSSSKVKNNLAIEIDINGEYTYLGDVIPVIRYTTNRFMHEDTYKNNVHVWSYAIPVDTEGTPALWDTSNECFVEVADLKRTTISDESLEGIAFRHPLVDWDVRYNPSNQTLSFGCRSHHLDWWRNRDDVMILLNNYFGDGGFYGSERYHPLLKKRVSVEEFKESVFDELQVLCNTLENIELPQDMATEQDILEAQIVEWLAWLSNGK